LILALHRFQQDQFLKQQNELNFSILQIGFQTVFLLLHFLDFCIEVIDQSFRFGFELSFLVLQFNAHDLIILLVEFGLHLLVALAWGDSVEVGVRVIVGWFQFGFDGLVLVGFGLLG